MLQSLYVVLPKQSFGSSTGQVERAIVECHFANGHLQVAVGLSNEK